MPRREESKTKPRRRADKTASGAAKHVLLPASPLRPTALSTPFPSSDPTDATARVEGVQSPLAPGEAILGLPVSVGAPSSSSSSSKGGDMLRRRPGRHSGTAVTAPSAVRAPDPTLLDLGATQVGASSGGGHHRQRGGAAMSVAEQARSSRHPLNMSSPPPPLMRRVTTADRLRRAKSAADGGPPSPPFDAMASTASAAAALPAGEPLRVKAMGSVVAPVAPSQVAKTVFARKGKQAVSVHMGSPSRKPAPKVPDW